MTEPMDSTATPDDGEEPGVLGDLDHGVPGDAEPLPDGDAENNTEDAPADPAPDPDDAPEELDDSDDEQFTGDAPADDGAPE